MKILILGGSHFVGFHIAAVAIANGHAVTLFNRGKATAHRFPEVEYLVGDRDGGLDSLKGKSWDLVIDVSGYLPRLVRDSAIFLRENVGRYLFISTSSVYDEKCMTENGDESAELAVLQDLATETISDLTYGGLKALCEKNVTDLYGSRALIFRLGLVAGPKEKFSERLYWARRVALGGEILVPMVNNDLFKFIDVRDIAEFVQVASEKGLSGTYNVGGQADMTLLGWLQACQIASGSDARFTGVTDHDFLAESRLYADIPFSEKQKILSVCSDKAIQCGLSHRSLQTTALDIFNWDSTQPVDKRALVGLSLQREAELLKQWHKREAVGTCTT